MKVKLKVLIGKSAGKEIPIPAPRFLIGRSNDCHLRPKSDSISRNHCTILTRDDEVVIRDLNSRNGTFVNGERITEEEEIKHGDQLQIGKLEFQVIVKQEAVKEVEAAPPEADNVEAPTELISPESAKDPDSLEFDVNDWLEEANTSDKGSNEAEPETRQFQLDDTDQMAVAKDPKQEPKEPEPVATRSKKKPGKLPPRSRDMTESSREAAADMLKKFFNSR